MIAEQMKTIISLINQFKAKDEEITNSRTSNNNVGTGFTWVWDNEHVNRNKNGTGGTFEKRGTTYNS